MTVMPLVAHLAGFEARPLYEYNRDYSPLEKQNTQNYVQSIKRNGKFVRFKIFAPAD